MCDKIVTASAMRLAYHVILKLVDLHYFTLSDGNRLVIDKMLVPLFLVSWVMNHTEDVLMQKIDAVAEHAYAMLVDMTGTTTLPRTSALQRSAQWYSYRLRCKVHPGTVGEWFVVRASTLSLYCMSYLLNPGPADLCLVRLGMHTRSCCR